MVRLTSEQLRKLQMIELEMLKEIDRICRKYNIQYSLDGGTLLGAIRHGGFIPWDDDADIVMLRSEYEKFYRFCQKELNTEKFFLQEFRTDTDYRWGYSKMRRTGTIFLREGQEHIKCNQGVFVDIFICDNVPDSFLLKRIYWMVCFCVRKGLYSVVGEKMQKNILEICGYKILSKIPRGFWEYIIHAMSKRWNRVMTENVGHMTYPYPQSCKYGMPRECFESYIEKEFEGYHFKIFENYDLYLKLLFGEYMKLPPVSERKTHPVSKISLI